jgi:hypothetical protein
LWRELPVSILRYRTVDLPEGLGLARLTETLRSRAWREHCAAPGDRSCADESRDCAFASSGGCRADRLFPMRLGGGAPQWRMATLFVRGVPSLSELRIVAFGDTACGELGWVARCLRERHGLSAPDLIGGHSLSAFELAGGTRFDVRFITPWVVGKAPPGVAQQRIAAVAAAEHETVARTLRESMIARGQKLTALCAQESRWQRIGGHLARMVGEALLPSAVSIERAQLESWIVPLETNAGRRFDAVAWLGEVTLEVRAEGLPWLTLISLCGGGKNAEKGFGAVEITSSKSSS